MGLDSREGSDSGAGLNFGAVSDSRSGLVSGSHSYTGVMWLFLFRARLKGGHQVWLILLLLLLTYHFCLSLPAAFTQPGARLLAALCIGMLACKTRRQSQIVTFAGNGAANGVSPHEGPLGQEHVIILLFLGQTV